MCCGNKKKKQSSVKNQQNEAQNVNSSPPAQPANTNTSQNPKSTISYAANDFENSSNVNQENFVLTKKAQFSSMDKIDRQEDYSHEINSAQKSHLIQHTSLLTYNLDNDDGVSKTPVINTFHYESSLNHCFLHHYDADQYNNRNTGSNQPSYTDAYYQRGYQDSNGQAGGGNQSYQQSQQYGRTSNQNVISIQQTHRTTNKNNSEFVMESHNSGRGNSYD